MNLKLFTLALIVIALPAQAELNDIKKVPASSTDWRVSQPICFLIDQKEQLSDLITICGQVNSSSGFIGSFGGSGATRSGATGGDSQCEYSTDRASDGSKCGKRAAFQKPGGN
jgi:hypothetical protein